MRECSEQKSCGAECGETDRVEKERQFSRETFSRESKEFPIGVKAEIRGEERNPRENQAATPVTDTRRDDEIAPVAWGACEDYSRTANAAMVFAGPSAAAAVGASAGSCAGASAAAGAGAAGGGAC